MNDLTTQQLNARDAAERLEAILEGRCLSDINPRLPGHRQSVCMLPEGHAPLMHDDCMGCTWTDADHWQQSAVDRADELEAAIERVRELAARIDRKTEVESEPVMFRDADTGVWWEVSDAIRATLEDHK